MCPDDPYPPETNVGLWKSEIGGSTQSLRLPSGNLEPMSPRAGQIVSLIVAAVSTVAGLYCVLWIFSAADMAFVECDGKYSLFSPIPRCRQPNIAMILATVLLALAAVIIFRILRSRKKAS